MNALSAPRTSECSTLARPEPAPLVRRGERLASLDGIRGIAVIVVMLFHFGSRPLVPGGFLAVDLFFALSGFLITALLTMELRATGTIDLKAFYVRRALRLLPAYLLVWLGYLLAVLLLPLTITSVPSWADCVQDLALGFAYIFNWKMALVAKSPPSIAHLWSLCIEEQYYLIWPCTLLLVHRLCKLERQALIALVGLALSACFVPLLLHQALGFGWRRLYYGTDARLHGLLMGSVIGYARACELRTPAWLRHPYTHISFAVFFIWVAANVFSTEPGSVDFLTGELPCLSAGFALLVGGASSLRRGVWHSVLTSRLATYFGRRSYALYLWHLPFAHWFRRLGPLPHVLLCFAASTLMAELSWVLVERRTLRLRVGSSGQPDRHGVRL